MSLHAPDVRAAVYHFVATHALPALNPDHIYQNAQNRAFTPPRSQPYAVITLLNTQRRGGTVERLDLDTPADGPGTLTLRELLVYSVRVDFYGPSAPGGHAAACADSGVSSGPQDPALPAPEPTPEPLNHALSAAVARAPASDPLPPVPQETHWQRAQCLEMLSRSAPGNAFFQRRGLSLLYAEPVSLDAPTDDNAQYLPRASLMLHLSGWACLDLPMDWFDAASLRLENVDVHHPE